MKPWNVVACVMAVAGMPGCSIVFHRDNDPPPVLPPGEVQPFPSSASYGARLGGATTPSPPDPTTETYERGEYLRGDMGTVVNFSGHTVDVHTSRNVVRLDTASATEHWWVMTQLEFPTGLSDPRLRPGVVIDSSADPNPVSVLGCSGPTPGTFTFDQHAGHVTVSVGPGSTPDRYRMQYTAEFLGARDQTVEGAFEYDIPR